MIEHRAVFSFGAAGHAEQLSVFTNLPCGVTHTFVVKAGETTSGVAYTLNLRDAAGNLLFTKSCAHNTTTVLGPSTVENHEFPFINGGSIGIDPDKDAGVLHPDITTWVYAVKK